MGSHKNLVEELMQIRKENLICKLSDGQFYGEEFKGLNDDLRINNAKIRDLSNDLNKIQSRPTTRQLGSLQDIRNVAFSVAEGMVSMGVFSWFILKASMGMGTDTNALMTSIILDACIVGNIANRLCYESKPLSNAVNKLLAHHKEKNINKLIKDNDGIEFIQKMLACNDDVQMCSDEQMCVEDMER